MYNKPRVRLLLHLHIEFIVNSYWMRFFVISRIFKVEVGAICQSLRLITLTEILIILDNNNNLIQ